MKKDRVLVAMSGGIDSTVAAILLHNQGYEVIGITMKTWDYQISGGRKKETGCCSLDSINDARKVAVDFGFPHNILDLREEFGESIIDNFVDEYISGRTPNPCVLCNTHIKWEALLKRADMLNCKYIATGHYARVRELNGRYVIYKGVDEIKDQSYVLWGVSQDCLSRTIFPMGKYHKDEIKRLAIDLGYESLAKKSESYEICFIPDNDYRSFLKRRVKGLEEKVQNGKKPSYVIGIDPSNNTVTIGSKQDLDKQIMHIRDVNFGKLSAIKDGTKCLVKIRYKHVGEIATIFNVDKNLKIVFHKHVKGIAPGQSAVLYSGDDVIAGGFII